MSYQPSDGKWQIGPNAELLFELRSQMTPEEYAENKKALQEFLCGYFSSGNCANSQGDSISPLKATPRGGKVLKVRWGIPGSGKSSSLRLVVVAYCDQKRVHIAQAFARRDNPTDNEFLQAADDL